MVKNCGKHDRIVNDLADRVRLWHPGSIIRTHYKYPYGEVDMMQQWTEYRQTYSEFLSTIHFHNYEIKSNDSLKNRNKAKEQLQRFQQYLEKKFWDKDKMIHSIYVYGIGDDSYLVADLGSHKETQIMISGWE